MQLTQTPKKLYVGYTSALQILKRQQNEAN